MPATLHFSNSLDTLADRLLKNLAETDADPFTAPSIATPASALRDWLKIRMAEKSGIAVNIAFPHLENLLWERLAERDPERRVAGRQPARLLDSFSFQGLILSHLQANPPGPIGAYLKTEEPAERARRLVQLSGRLAALFREYEYSRVAEHGRPGLAESWMRGERCFGRHAVHPDVPELEGWQMAIYQALFRQGDGLRDRWGESAKTYRYTLPQYAAMVLGKASAAQRPETSAPGTAPPVFHLFGLSNVSPFHRDLIGRLADEKRLGDAAARFEIYALNPCAGFWEDALTDRERQARAKNRGARRLARDQVARAQPGEAEIGAGVIAEAPDENGLLALFGKPGRETIKLWCQLTDHDFEEDFRAPRKDTLLATVQKSVLSRLGPLPGAETAAPDDIARIVPDKDDASLRVFSAPDPRIEMEHVRAEIARLLRDDATLRPEDMAVIPADPDAALPLIRAVFAGGGAIAGNVPVLLPGADTSADSPLLRGFRDLLSPSVLAGDRNAVLALLENPAVRRKAEFGADKLRAVRAFWEAAGFQEGWGEEAGEGEVGLGGIAASSTARSSEERAVLAAALDPDDDAVAGSGFWPARGVTGLLDREENARLIDWLARLRAALRPFRAAPRLPLLPYAEWAALLRALLDDFLRAETDDAADRRAVLDLRAFFAEMEAWDRWNDPPARVSGELVRTLFEDAFRDPDAARTAFLRGGVRVGGLMALRGIPFRRVWVTGLASGTFPAPGEAAPLDLRGYRRLPGESDPAARDLYALLEVIASTTESLALSWVRRDAAKDADVSPSRALTGLKTWLDSDVLAAGCEFRFGCLQAAPLPIHGGTPDEAHAVKWADAPTRERRLLADWSHLADFLENPAVHAAKVHFGLRPYDALDFSEEERAAGLFFDTRADAAILDPVLRAELVQPGNAERIFLRLWAERQRGGLLPPPPYDAVERARLHAEVTGALTQKADHLRALLDGEKLTFAGSLRVGPQDSKSVEPPIVSIPAFDAEPLGVPVKVGGVLPWFFQGSGPEGGWAVLVEEGKEISAYLLQLCVDALGQAATPGAPSPILRGPGHVIVRRKKADAPEKAFTLHSLPETWAHDAAAVLRSLIEDLAGAPSFDDLPLTGIESIRKGLDETDQVQDWSEAIEDWRRDEEEKTFSGPKFWDRVAGTLKVAVPDDAGALVARRALPYLDWKDAWHPAKKKSGERGDEDDDIDGRVSA